MTYDFPVIKNISDVLPAIAGKEEFIVADRGTHKIINYLVQFSETFEDPYEDGISEQEKSFRLIRRECRGITFDAVTGKIIARKLNKFFNLGEKPETRSENVDISKPHIILDKLDGSMIVPFYANDKLIFGTKMGATDQATQVEEFLKDKPNYYDFCRDCITISLTPIFEFTSPSNRIVINYTETKLTLLAVRGLNTGLYKPYAELTKMCEYYNIPLVRALAGGISNMEKFVEDTRALSGEEGYVVRFDDGLMVKIKSDEYILKHRCKDSISQEKNLVELIFTDKIDDVYAVLDMDDADKVRKYADSVLHRVSEVAEAVTEIAVTQKEILNNDKKRFALEIVPLNKEFSGILFAVWDGRDARETIVKQVLNNCATQTKINSVRQFLGPLVWNDVYTSTMGE